jgi:hypothetical protein
MKLDLARKVYMNRQPRAGEQASIRMVLLAVISFLLGVAATAVWFQHGPKRNTENPVIQESGQPATPAANATTLAQPFVQARRSATPETLAKVKQTLPNYASLTVDQGAEVLRQAALKEFASAATEMQSQIAKAEAELSEARNDNSAAGLQSATQHLRQVQAEQTAKIQQIAANLQLELAGLQQLKAATNSAR